MAACGHSGQLPASTVRVSHQTRAPLNMQRGSAAASRRILKGCSWVPAAVPQCGGEAAAVPGCRSVRSTSRGHLLSRALEVKDGDVHVVWCSTDKVHKSLSLWQLFKERFLPRSELTELGMDGGASSSDSNSSKQAGRHEQQREQQQHAEQQREQHCEGGESTWSHQDERLLARVLTRTTLASAINGLGGEGSTPLQPRDICFSRNIHGKPFLEQPRVGDLLLQPVEPNSQTHSLEAPGFYEPVAGQQPASQHIGRVPLGGDLQPLNGHVHGAKTLWAPDLGLGAHGLPMLQFNTTHTSGVVGCALAPGNIAVGLDVERLGRVPKGGKLMALARRRFAAAECAALEACDDEVQQARLFSYLWSLKEAALKARGTGISAPPGLRGFAIGLHPWQHRHNDQASQALDLSSALQQLCPGLQGVPESQHIWNSTAGLNDSRTHSAGGSSHNISGAPLFHITMQPGADQQQSEAEQPRYHFLLFHLGTQHVGALCLAVPPDVVWPPAHPSISKSVGIHPQPQASSTVPGYSDSGCATVAALNSEQQVAAVPSAVTKETTGPLVRVHFWEGAPQSSGHVKEMEFALSAAPVQMEVAVSDGGLGSGNCSAGPGQPVVLVGCTAS